MSHHSGNYAELIPKLECKGVYSFKIEHVAHWVDISSYKYENSPEGSLYSSDTADAK